MDEIQSILDYTRKHRLYLTTVLPYIIVRRKEEAERVASEIMEGLESDDPDRVGESARAIRHWVHLASKGFVEGPRREIVDSLVFRVAFRRPAGIQKCIEQLSYLVVDEPEGIGENQLKLLVSALPAWQDATSLTGDEGGQSGFAEGDRPELRVRIGELASALGRQFSSEAEPPAISDMRKSYATDNLPEVRRAFDRWN